MRQFRRVYRSVCQGPDRTGMLEFVGVDSLWQALPVVFPQDYRRWKRERKRREADQDPAKHKRRRQQKKRRRRQQKRQRRAEGQQQQPVGAVGT